jgi:hypothetical protein
MLDRPAVFGKGFGRAYFGVQRGRSFAYAGGNRRERRATVVELITHNRQNVNWYDRYNRTSAKELRGKIELELNSNDCELGHDVRS